MATNPAREALTRAVNRAIENGAPVYINQPAPAHRALREEAGFENRSHVTVYRTELVALLQDRDALAQALADVLEYAERYADLNDEPPDGECADACARAAALIKR